MRSYSLSSGSGSGAPRCSPTVSRRSGSRRGSPPLPLLAALWLQI